MKESDLTIPCSQCLKLPICINKCDILCNDLYYQFKHIADQLQTHKINYTTAWNIVEQTLPHLQHMDKEQL